MKVKMSKPLLWVSYFYLTLPVVIFLLGWCRWYIGIPVALVCVVSVYKCVNDRGVERFELSGLTAKDICCLLVAAVVIFAWVWYSGIGCYTFQNTDHPYRNAIFEILVNEEWPVRQGDRGLIYYIGYWMPAAVVGKIAGMSWGYATQFAWALLGIWLVYALICVWREEIQLWPLLVLIFFSGMDIVGSLLFTNDSNGILGMEHVERWAGLFQYSSNTTQLYWVFNQALPAWVATLLIFLDERPRNILFVSSLIILTSILPFAGLIPIVCYYMYSRCRWECSGTEKDRLKLVIRNWGSFQNLMGAGGVGAVTMVYLMGNEQFKKLLLLIQRIIPYSMENFSYGFLVLIFCTWIVGVVFVGFLLVYLLNKEGVISFAKRVSPKFYMAMMLLFVAIFIVWKMKNLGILSGVKYFARYGMFLLLDVVVLLCALYKYIKNKSLFWLIAIWLCIIPVIQVGEGIDFCMRASIPAMFIVMIWCIEVLGQRRKEFWAYAVAACMLVGAVTAHHEIKRGIVETSEGYNIEVVQEEEIFNAGNFSGSLDTIFWKCLAKEKD